MVEFDRFRVEHLPIASRYSQVDITMESAEPFAFNLSSLSAETKDYIYSLAYEIKESRKVGASVVCAFGAHSIKNGLGRVLGTFLQKGWFTHICTNGAGIIHDWEFAYQGKSSEDVRANIREGQFGIWQETGFYINLAISLGAYNGLGYAESVGRMVNDEGLEIPDVGFLTEQIRDDANPLWRRAAAADLLDVIGKCGIDSGFMKIEHPFRRYSIHSYLGNDGIFTCHPMFGHDVIYTHYANKGSAIGRTSEHDFLSYANSISNLQHGVYLSVGSAVMSPMIFEKSLSMSRNVIMQQGKRLNDFSIHVVDLQESTWDWRSATEPPRDNPAYYLRFMKTFNRMGGRTDYRKCDNRVLFCALLAALREICE